MYINARFYINYLNTFSLFAQQIHELDLLKSIRLPSQLRVIKWINVYTRFRHHAKDQDLTNFGNIFRKRIVKKVPPPPTINNTIIF